MSDIKIAVKQLPEPSKKIGEILIEFYETMKMLENDKHRGGKQATKIVMTINDIEGVFDKSDFINSFPKSRCCGRCDGVNDLCVSDMACNEHNKQGCEVCWPHPGNAH